MPFEVKRVYYIFGTQSGVIRGRHAHRNLTQVAVCVHGACTFALDNGRGGRCEIRLDRPTRGLLIESMTWREMADFSSDCVLMILANRNYDPNDYLFDYAKFCEAATSMQIEHGP